jgi:hypothetical protein
VLELRIASVEPPLSESSQATSLGLFLVARAQVMGLLPDPPRGPIALDRGFVAGLADRLEREGIAVIAAHRLRRVAEGEATDEAELVGALRAVLEAIDASPYPEGEWEPARELLGDELLSRLLRVSGSSLRRYAAEERRTPDDTAWRLHLIARLLSALLGSYNDYGIRRWFERSRSALGGATPRAVLELAESEDDGQLQSLVALADGLMGAAAAA